MKELPRLELTEDPNKKNDFIIFRHSSKTKYVTNKKRHPKKKSVKKTMKKSIKKTMKKRKSKKGFFGSFF